MLSCVIINFNGKELLSGCIDSLLAMKNVEKEVVVLDNLSTDGSVDFLRKHYPKIRIIQNKVNRGYAGGANDAIRETSGEYVMLLNPDIRLNPDYAATLLMRMRYAKDVGAIAGKLLKYDFKNDRATKIIDSAGLQMFKNRRCVDRGQGEHDIGQYEVAEEVFGVTGACPLYRREALEDVMVCGEYFDEDFFMYKEDVDISWRMRLFGWACFYDPQAIGFHGRGTGAVLRKNLVEVAKKRSDLSKFQRGLSYRNERLMRLKNEFLSMFFGNAHNILLKEFLFLGLMLSSERFLFKSFFEILRYAPRAFKKRRIIQRRKIISARDLRRWFI